MIGVAIPSRFRFEPLMTLLYDLQGYETLVMDNGYTPKERQELSEVAQIVQCEGRTIYEMWNLAWDWAAASEIDHLALLNDDVTIDEFTLPTMGNYLQDGEMWVVSPDPDAVLGSPGPYRLKEVSGTYKDGGILGWCFMFDVSRYARGPFDEHFQWWGGDDQFIRDTIDAGGKCAKIEGLGIEHLGEASSRLIPGIEAIKSADIELMRQRGLW